MSSTQHQLIEQCATRLRGIVEALDNIHDNTPHRWSTDLDDVHSSAESLLALIKDQAPARSETSFEEWLANELEGEDGQPVPAAVCDITLARRAFNHWPKLEQPAKVGGVRFSAGVSSRLVVEAAQRLYEFESTPEQEAERIERLQAFREQLDPLNLAPHAEAFNEAPDEALRPEQAEAERPEVDVTRILLDIVPGDGDGHEVYAKSVADVEAKLAADGDRIEDLELKLHAALARVAELESATSYIEVRQCVNCRHIGINDAADYAACHDCRWTGPEPDEDKCPGCAGENCMAAACPECGGRYELVAEANIATPVAQAGQVPQAWLDVQAERRRQVEAEGWTPEHDDEHSHGQMARASACYALAGSSAPNDGTAALLVSLAWPWDEQWWKPSTARRDLVKAGALVLAEIERLDLAGISQSPQPGATTASS
ncbi:hypothetical protein [Pseudomonas aeruginosa]|uniref:hypothetical protein n=1 Tax=Pseudomonas aeruginosa TaxID=287 RepID=UPI001CFFDEEB|nr:hypothetical protein [Pseudomonas aeruginosa]